MNQQTNCPRCAGALNLHQHDPGIQVMRCDECAGIFCESATYELLLDTSSADTLDTGRNVADKSKFVEKMTCPNCSGVMATYRFPPQPHIKIDRCASCLSVFLDAGELKDMKDYTLLDWFRDLRYKD